ncbi:hypothetical protein NEMIN01_0248 [Nematocida minor]|uniref:uncharacterized protein n=1 Tax=Nematocida minor TaxID=1912983 RepID=UPI00221F74A9|nr:uncharacterized protein NEMIN01_0248 [Nematocida minor]KAI5188984.1 hypothetical protein NEMIN01_0248 [Nematocida minor]
MEIRDSKVKLVILLFAASLFTSAAVLYIYIRLNNSSLSISKLQKKEAEDITHRIELNEEEADETDEPVEEEADEEDEEDEEEKAQEVDETDESEQNKEKSKILDNGCRAEEREEQIDANMQENEMSTSCHSGEEKVLKTLTGTAKYIFKSNLVQWTYLAIFYYKVLLT